MKSGRPIMAAVLAALLSACHGTDDGARPVRESAITGVTEQPAAVALHDCDALSAFVATELGGLRAEALHEGATIVAIYRPAELIACLEAGGTTVLNDSAFSALCAPYRATQQFMLRFPRTIGDDVLARITAADLLEVEDGTDTVACAFIHVEAAPSPSRYHTVIVGFDHAADGREKQLLWKDRGPPVQFRFKPGAFGRYHEAITSKRTARP